jgi:hypothetical protein
MISFLLIMKKWKVYSLKVIVFAFKFNVSESDTELDGQSRKNAIFISSLKYLSLVHKSAWSLSLKQIFQKNHPSFAILKVDCVYRIQIKNIDSYPDAEF